MKVNCNKDLFYTNWPTIINFSIIWRIDIDLEDDNHVMVYGKDWELLADRAWGDDWCAHDEIDNISDFLAENGCLCSW